MSKGLPVQTGDENIEGGSYEQAAEGKHTVVGIKEFFNDCMTDAGPIFVERNGDLKISFEFLKENAEEKGPTFSVTPAEFLALAVTFGVDINALGINRKNRATPAIVLAVKDAINAQKKHLVVESNADGWVNRIDQMHLPVDAQYTVVFKEAIGSEGSLDWFQGKFGGFMLFKFEVVADGHGNPSMWEGFPITLFMNNEFVREETDHKGDRLVATEIGKPLYGKTPNGGIPRSAMRWTNFAVYFAPAVLDHEWAVSPDNSAYGVCEVHEPQHVFVKKALEAKSRVVVGYKKFTSNKGNVRYEFDLNDLGMFNSTREIVSDNDVSQPRALDQLLDYFVTNKAKWDIQPEIDLFEQSPADSDIVIFTDAGKAWAEKVLLPKWTELGLGEKKPLHELTEDEAQKLLNAFTSAW